MVTFHDTITAHIAAHGLSVVGVVGQGEPTFSYTIGLSPKFGFELLVLGLSPQYAKAMFNAIAGREKAPDLDVPVAEVSNLPVMFKRCDRDLKDLHDAYVCQADRYYDTPVNVVQMVMPDRQGKPPGDPAFDEAYMGRIQRLFFTPETPDQERSSRPRAG